MEFSQNLDFQDMTNFIVKHIFSKSHWRVSCLFFSVEFTFRIGDRLTFDYSK